MDPTIVIPTSINFLTAISSYMLESKRQGLETTVTAPSLRERAKMIIEERGTIPLLER